MNLLPLQTNLLPLNEFVSKRIRCSSKRICRLQTNSPPMNLPLQTNEFAARRYIPKWRHHSPYKLPLPKQPTLTHAFDTRSIVNTRLKKYLLWVLKFRIILVFNSLFPCGNRYTQSAHACIVRRPFDFFFFNFNITLFWRQPASFITILFHLPRAFLQ